MHVVVNEKLASCFKPAGIASYQHGAALLSNLLRCGWSLWNRYPAQSKVCAILFTSQPLFLFKLTSISTSIAALRSIARHTRWWASPTPYRDSALSDNTGQSSEPATSVCGGSIRSRGERVLEDCRKTTRLRNPSIYLIPTVLQFSTLHLLSRRLQSGCSADQWRKSPQMRWTEMIAAWLFDYITIKTIMIAV